MFVGVHVPDVRTLARDGRSVQLDDIDALLQPEIHEARLLGAILAVDVDKSAKTPVETRDKIIALVLTRVEYLDNWDLVDTVAPYTPGPWLLDRSQGEQDAVLDDLTASPLLWRRRFAMVSTLAMIRAGEMPQAFRLAETLIDDRHDLMHTAVGGCCAKRASGIAPRSMRFSNVTPRRCRAPPCATRSRSTTPTR